MSNRSLPLKPAPFVSQYDDIAGVPGDFASPSARAAGARWRLMTPPQHLWYFTLESVERMAHALGLRIERYDHPWKIRTDLPYRLSD